MRDPVELLISAQIRLTELRSKLPIRRQAEWEDLTEAIALMEKCRKQLESK
jgi:hypothetical protein